MSTKRKTKGSSNRRATGSGRVTPSNSAKRSGSAQGAGSAKGSGASDQREPKARAVSSRAAAPDLNVGAVDRLVARVEAALPRGRVRSAFSGTSGLSPNAVTVLGAIPGVVVVGVAVASKRPALLVLAVAVMAASIAALMKWGNTTRVVAELPDELVVFSSRGGQLEPHHRGPVDVGVRPYFDGRWLKVEVGDDELFVSKRAYGAIVRRLVGADDEASDPDDGATEVPEPDA